MGLPRRTALITMPGKPNIIIVNTHDSGLCFGSDSSARPILAEMDVRLWKWMENVGDDLITGPPRTSHYEHCIKAYQQACCQGQPITE